MTVITTQPTATMRAERLTAHIGAQVTDVDLAQVAHDDNLFAELRALLIQHKVLFFRDQPISRADHVALARRFGELESHPVLGSDPDHPGLVRIYKDLDSDREAYENAFHCDATWRECPPFGSVLRCVEGPDVGGDTIWVDMVAAYNALPQDVKDRIADLRARHSIEASFGARLPIEQRHALHAKFPDAEHPVVRTHPDTGEKILFVNAFATHLTNFHNDANIRFGFDYAPGAGDLLQYLQRQAAVPEFQVRWRWTPDSFAIWDNRCTQHYAVQDYWPAVRRMERAGIVGDRPY
ncbi:TauD/TfdA dioxygenase family protein [Tsukamurella pseudospumae]|uniref:Taurine dioxygenase n=1 Tax=Tsukamurella pseudospumae TaxID=239498 RepID=A0A138AWD3_9ACTN|nr:TauD/TfdA family dioxygenase [Tsukamurella pseudospumae]KXP01592.1 taurine dioxygenase [Tsukamurella pseudospumae]KXP14743.1 taurine dioxygenase [Tsukamurella pseudospumae]